MSFVIYIVSQCAYNLTDCFVDHHILFIYSIVISTYSFYFFYLQFLKVVIKCLILTLSLSLFSSICFCFVFFMLLFCFVLILFILLSLTIKSDETVLNRFIMPKTKKCFLSWGNIWFIRYSALIQSYNHSSNKNLCKEEIFTLI